jgi:hypothetical protein
MALRQETCITILGASPAGYNLVTFTNYKLSMQTPLLIVANTLSTPATGTITANKQVPYTCT